MEGIVSPSNALPPRRIWRYLMVGVTVFASILVLAFMFIIRANEPPENFPVATPINIESGQSITSIVKTLHEENVIRFELLLYAVLLTRYTPSDVKASTYVFDKPYTTLAVAAKLVAGDFSSNLVRITHKEGETVAELARAVAEALPDINTSEFLSLASTSEGYLWPETYFIPPHYNAAGIIKTMREAHDEFMAEHQVAVENSGLTESDIIILASIIEREANTRESMNMVAGILRNRLDIGMALQADASIEYVLGKPLEELLPEDLKRVSPYNTYLNVGLPPTPIGNPGENAILAVIYPTKSSNFYYITGVDGVFHYAENFDVHRRNIARYLR